MAGMFGAFADGKQAVRADQASFTDIRQSQKNKDQNDPCDRDLVRYVMFLDHACKQSTLLRTRFVLPSKNPEIAPGCPLGHSYRFAPARYDES
jgi:hypothetical protein